MSVLYSKIIQDQERLQKLTRSSGTLSEFCYPNLDILRNNSIDAALTRLLEMQHYRNTIVEDIYSESITSKALKRLRKHNSPLQDTIPGTDVTSTLWDQSELMKSINIVTKANRLHAELFRLPRTTELYDIAAQVRETKKLNKISSTVRDQTQHLKNTMQRMTQPWMHLDSALTSATGFASLQAIGSGISTFNPFERNLVENLRPFLGDWRDSISIPSNKLIKPKARIKLYRDQGVDPLLTDFPTLAFHESVTIAGLYDVIDDEQSKQYDYENEEVHDVIRAERAYKLVRRLEIALRKFIVRVMLDAFGEHWMKKQLPQDMYEKWQEKRKNAIDEGKTGQSLIDYADFSDYKMIIERKDNWRTVFCSVFRRPEDIRESLQRLNPVRVATMHSRIITMEDELYLLAESKRILKAISS